MTFADWTQIAQVALLAVVPALGWLARRLALADAKLADVEKRVSVMEEHDVGEVKDTLHGRVTDVATQLAGVRGSLDQLNHTNSQLLATLIQEPRP